MNAEVDRWRLLDDGEPEEAARRLERIVCGLHGCTTPAGQAARAAYEQCFDQARAEADRRRA
jgi:hypothetical protein